jgi:hypothetical protein
MPTKYEAFLMEPDNIHVRVRSTTTRLSGESFTGYFVEISPPPPPNGKDILQRLGATVAPSFTDSPHQYAVVLVSEELSSELCAGAETDEIAVTQAVMKAAHPEVAKH